MVTCVECKKQTEENEPNKIKFCVMKYWNVCECCEAVETFRTCSKCKQSLCYICESKRQHQCPDSMSREGEEE